MNSSSYYDSCCAFCKRKESELAVGTMLFRGFPHSHVLLNPQLRSLLDVAFRRADMVQEGRRYHDSACVHICGDCVSGFMDSVFKHADTHGMSALTSGVRRHLRATSEDVVAYLDRHVIGQVRAKRALAIAVWQHYRRMQIVERTVGDVALARVCIEKSNVLMIGPTGVGKTLLASRVAEFLEVPFVTIDATEVTEAGYVGQDASMCIRKLLEKAGGDIKRAEGGIVYIDEVDKIRKKTTSGSVDVHGEGAQQGFLKILEGCDVSIATTKGGAEVTVNTRNILFIASGAFDGLMQIVEKRLVGDCGIGFAAQLRGSYTERDCLHAVDTDDLVKYGLISEFLGRLPIIAVLEPLDVKAIERVLVEPENALLKQYQKMFALAPYAVELVFSEEVIQEIASSAIGRNTGARGLRRVLETRLQDLLFTLPGIKLRSPHLVRVVITKATLDGGSPEFVHDSNLCENTLHTRSVKTAK